MEPTQRPGRSGAWKSEPAIGTRPIGGPVSPAPPGGALTPGPSTSIAPRPPAPRIRRSLPADHREDAPAGNPARAPDQGDRLGPDEPRLGDLGRAAVAEVAGERLAMIGHLAGPRQPVGQVPRPERRPGEGPPERLEVDGGPRPASRSTISRNRSARAAQYRGCRPRPGSSSRTKWPRMWISRPSSSALSSIPAISSMPSRSASGRATAMAESVSWSVIASAESPTPAAATGRPRPASRRRRNGSCGRAGPPRQVRSALQVGILQAMMAAGQSRPSGRLRRCPGPDAPVGGGARSPRPRPGSASPSVTGALAGFTDRASASPSGGPSARPPRRVASGASCPRTVRPPGGGRGCR